MSISRKEMLNFARLLDDLFNNNLFFPYCISHKEDKNIFNVIESIQTIINEAITTVLTEDEKNLLFERYGIGINKKSIGVIKLAKKYNLEFSEMNCKLENIISKLIISECVWKLDFSFFNPNIDKDYFFKFKDFFDKKFVEIYYDELRNTENIKHFKIWRVFEKYSQI